MAISAVLAWTAVGTERFLTSPAIGGLLIGSSQAVSLLLTSTAVGVSTAYERLSQHILQTVKGKHTTQSRMASRPIIFSMGIIAGSKALLAQSHSRDYLFAAAAIPRWQVFAGGVLMTFGARLTGGCTSEHDLCAIGATSASSLVSVAAMFGAGILTRVLLWEGLIFILF